MEQLGLLAIVLLVVIVWRLLTRPMQEQIEREAARYFPQEKVDPAREKFVQMVVSRVVQMAAAEGEKPSPETTDALIQFADRAYLKNPAAAKQRLMDEDQMNAWLGIVREGAHQENDAWLAEIPQEHRAEAKRMREEMMQVVYATRRAMVATEGYIDRHPEFSEEMKSKLREVARQEMAKHIRKDETTTEQTTSRNP